MLRPHTFTALGPHSFVFVLKDRSQVQLSRRSDVFQQCLASLPHIANVLGFYIRSKSTTMADARVYYPDLGSSLPEYKQLCPVRLFKDVGNRGWIMTGFLKSIGKGAPLKTYLQQLVSSKTPVSPYALSIGEKNMEYHAWHGSSVRRLLGHLEVPRSFCQVLSRETSCSSKKAD